MQASTGQLLEQGVNPSACFVANSAETPCAFSRIKLNFKDSKGNLIRTVEANEGDDILAVAHEYDIDLEGACVDPLSLLQIIALHSFTTKLYLCG